MCNGQPSEHAAKPRGRLLALVLYLWITITNRPIWTWPPIARAGFPCLEHNLRRLGGGRAKRCGRGSVHKKGRPSVGWSALSRSGERRASIDCCEVPLDNVAISLEPIAVFDELAALHGPDLHPTTTLVIL